MKLRKLDQTLLVLGLILIVISFYQLFFQSRENFGNEKALGTLSLTEAVVKTKSALALDWRDAFIGGEVTENQLIYTDANSSADVVFIEGDKITISENSLVKIRSGKNPGLSVEKGFVRAKVEGDTPLIVSMNGQDFSLSGDGADVQINLNSGKGEIGVLSGSITVEGKGVKENLDKNLALNIDGNQFATKAITFQQLTPERQKKIYIPSGTTPIRFSWVPANKGKLYLAQNAELEGAQVHEGTGELLLDLGAGQYHWKIEDEKGSSLISSFQVVEESALKILRPLQGQKVDVLEQMNVSTSVVLQWKGESAQRYKVEWDQGEVKSRVIKGTNIPIEVDKAGSLKWRVRVEDAERPHAVWSDWQEIDVNIIRLPKVPVELAPHQVDYQIYEETVHEDIKLTWQSIHPAEIEILMPSGEQVVKLVKDVSYLLETKAPGAYQWRARSKDVFKRVSEWSDWRNFEIQNFTEEYGDGVRKIQLKRPDQEVKFTWEKTADGEASFQLSRNKDFSDIIVQKSVVGEATSVVVPDIGDFYWKVSNGKPKKVIIEKAPAPVKPERLPDLEVPIDWGEDKSTSLWDWFIPKAYADDLTGSVRLTVPLHEDAKFYIIRVYKDQDLQELLFEKKLTQNEFDWEVARPGTYYWQHSIIDYWDRESLFSDPALLTVTEGDLPQPAQPRLLSPAHAAEVIPGDLAFQWTKSGRKSKYEFQLAADSRFKKIFYSKRLKKNHISLNVTKLRDGVFYWRVRAINRWKQEALSHTGQFVVKRPPPPPPVLPVAKVEEPKRPEVVIPIWKKIWKSRASLALAPSKDNYTFSEGGLSGTIDGIAKLGLEAKGTIFTEKRIYQAEFIRQTGSVFKGETYSFQRLMADFVQSWGEGDHRFGLGLGIGQTSGQGYDIDLAKKKVVAVSASGMSYGPVIRSYHAFSETWEMQNKLMYFIGEIKQLEVSAEWLKHKKNYYWLGGVGYGMREYKFNSGSQSSLKLTFGIGKEF